LAPEAGSRGPQAPSFDTVTLRHLCLAPCPAGFRRVRDERGERYVYNAPPSGGLARPHLTYSEDPTGRRHLSATVSISKMLYGHNVDCAAAEDLLPALDEISDFVSSVTGVEFDARTARVGRLDVCQTFPVGEAAVHLYLRALALASLPRQRPRVYHTGIEWRDKTQKVIVYSKLAETLSRRGRRKATAEEVEAARGHLRIEFQFLTTGACRRLAEGRLRLPDRRAECLLRPEVAEVVMGQGLASLGLDRPIPPPAARLDLLRKSYGDGATFSRLCRFVEELEERGQEAVIESRSYETFRKTRAEIQAAGAWLVNPSATALPPLLSEPHTSARAAAMTSGG
jgi:hypothetical protein